MTSPFDYHCKRCGASISVHRFHGRKMRCDDGKLGEFEIWQVIEARRALGHKISPEWAVQAKRSKEDYDYRMRRRDSER